MVSGADSQWAEMTRIALGFVRLWPQAANSFGQVASSITGGAPWLR